MPGPGEQLVETIEATRAVNAHREAARAAVLMVNLGTPEAPTAKALRPYLRQFLSDRRVIEVPKPIWWFILNGFIVPFRSPKSAEAYARVWTEHGSPLLVDSRSLAHKLEAELQTDLPRVKVMLAMTYGQPDIDSAIDRLRRENIQRLLILPMYPQYSATTTASVFDQVTNSLQRLRWLPEVRFINNFHHDENWLSAVTESIRRFRKQRGAPDKLLFSFHGIPKKNLLAGDPYYCQCQASARNIAERLGLADGEWMVTFQSRLGRAEWLKPYTDQTLEELGHQGVKKLHVVCPGFSVDCLETLDEIAVEGRDEFLEAGGESLKYIPCLNDSPEHVKVLSALCRQHGQGWPEFAGGRDAGQSELEARVERSAAAAERLGLE
ncbi:ferrochelatase [Wenzhouxiangella sediminis]|uniref:Ferrochelatase n=2 Tax=Wenzhouxiangella sediminis TaxID=1792836 RepID=A0A3E1K7Y5_9GAMM|nr:ferrochelatase [Wenzhouxiangella sediminis]RFF30173.1 ferrochelatase [Wenzhouxiangella sediminis]